MARDEAENEAGVTNEMHFNKIDSSDVKQLEIEDWKNHKVCKEVKDLVQKCISIHHGFIQSRKWIVKL